MPGTDAKSGTRLQSLARYELFGKVIESDLGLPSLPLAERGDPSVMIRRQAEDALELDGARPVYELLDSTGAIVYRLDRRDGQYLWSYPDFGRFAVARDGRLIGWAAADRRRPDVAAALTGPVLSFALQLQGQTCLHGSAVVIDRCAIGILAPSHYGKSTTAVSLMARGYQLLTDDVIALEARPQGVHVLPSYPRLKLWPDMFERFLRHLDWEALPQHVSWLEKRVVPAADLGGVCPSARPLAALFLLAPAAPDSEIEVQRLHAKEALLALVANGYNAPHLKLEPDLQAGQLDLFGRIVEATPVYVIRSPRTFDRLDELADAILAYGRPTSRSRGVD